MTKLKGKVLAGKVVVKNAEAESQTASGLYIPELAKEKPSKGTVVLVGAARKDEPMEVKEGDEILYSKYGGQEFSIGDDKYLLINQNDILFIF